jgi:TetR/AcrR family transcriptional regulator, transcriptional repressor for nem operon
LTTREKRQPEETRKKLIESASSLMLMRGFNATTVDDICAQAGMTKGSFFHYFENKDDIGQAAAQAWGEYGRAMYGKASDAPGGPLDEIHRLFDIMEGFTRDPDPCVCLVGMFSQEMSSEHPAFRTACARELSLWTEMFRSRLEAAKQQHKASVDFDATQVSWFINSVWQGSMLIGRTQQSAQVIRNNLKIARNYVDSLFDRPQPATLSKAKKHRRKNHE